MTRRLLPLLAGAAVVAGCGASSQQQIATNLKTYLHATHIYQVQCDSQGTDGAGNPLKSCDVLYGTASCPGAPPPASDQDETTVMVDGTRPQAGQTLSISSAIGCNQP